MGEPIEFPNASDYEQQEREALRAAYNAGIEAAEHVLIQFAANLPKGYEWDKTEEKFQKALERIRALKKGEA